MIKCIAFIFFILTALLTTSTQASCNKGGSFSCESYTDNPLYGLILNPWTVYEGRYSCTAWRSRFYNYDIEDFVITRGMTLEINFKTTSSAELTIFAETTNGVQHVQRIRDHVVYDAVDGKRWHWQTYRVSLNSKEGATLERFRIKIDSGISIDDFSWEVTNTVSTPGSEQRYLELVDQTSFQYSLTQDDLFTNEAREWNLKLQGTLAGNDEVLLGLSPRNINPIFTPSCEEIIDYNFQVSSSEEGSDSFSVECLGGRTPLSDNYIYIRIRNNTAKSYCSPIQFNINTTFNLNISDEIESKAYTETFDIISTFN
ncbi:hypothetical protein [Halobacteriovorax sp.]|uniref:hypothetical protein n=1 Tax=Halobacteriovorax sp. TaxID=2020862 RepID=UPI003AF1E4B0